MKQLIAYILVAVVAIPLMAQTPSADMFIKGDMTIKYDTRTQLDGNSPKAGVTDKYNTMFNVNNSALFRGGIQVLPYIDNTFSDQIGKVTFDMECDVVNPKNPTQTKNVGKLFGVVPVDQNNVYRFADGTARISILGFGTATGFDSKFLESLL